MNISVFSFMMSVLSSTVFILSIHFLRGREYFLRAFGVHTILALYGLCLARMIFPIEMPFTVHIALQGLYSSLLAALSDTWLPGLLCGLWIAVAAAIFLHFFWNDFLVNKELAQFHQNRAPRAEKILERIQSTSARRTAVVVCLCPDIDIPMGAGLIRRRIYLPDEEYTDKELYYIIKHEYTHFCNHDLVSKFMVKILCCVFWWNPAVYVLKKDISQILEIQCDIDATKGFTKQERLEYLMTILRILGGRDSSKGKPPSMLTTGMLFDTGRSGIKERFTLLTREPLAAPRLVLALFWVLSVTAVILSYSVVFQPRAVQPQGSGTTVSDKFSEEVISFLISGVLWLFVLIQIKYQLFRNKGCSILALPVAALLCGTMALYMGNIQPTQKAIDALADTIPVKVNVVNRTGSRRTELFIEPQMFDGLNSAGVKDMFATAEAVGAWSESAKAQEPFFSGDVNMAALNHIRAWEGVDEDKLEWMTITANDVSGICSSKRLCTSSALAKPVVPPFF